MGEITLGSSEFVKIVSANIQIGRATKSPRKMLKIVLIHPQTSEINNILPPMGLLHVAAVLEKAGFDVEVYDEDPELFDFRQVLERARPDLVGFSLFTTNYARVRYLAKLVRKILPRAVVICGGIHATALPEQTLRALPVDFVVVGEGEYTTLELAQKLDAGKDDWESVLGLAFKRGDEVVVNPPRPLIENLDELPFPARHLLDFERYLMPPGYGRGAVFSSTMPLLATRGCPYRCSFCSSKVIFGGKIRRRSVRSVVQELLYLQKHYEFESFGFLDDNFASDREWLEEFCDELIRRGNEKAWGFPARVGDFDDALVKKLKAAGVFEVDFGVESGSPRVLKAIHKGTRVRHVVDTFALLKKHGIHRVASFIIGFPGETRRDVQLTYLLARRIQPDFTTFFFAVPFPGTELFEKNQRKLGRYLADWFGGDHLWRPFPINELGEEELLKTRSRVQNAFVLPNFLHWQNLAFATFMVLVNLRHPTRLISKLTAWGERRNLAELVRAMGTTYREAIVDCLARPKCRAGFLSRKFFFRSLFRHRVRRRREASPSVDD
ncbi:MAG: hypothetical protein Kow0069_29670 [Promethearchaeota archaeon]